MSEDDFERRLYNIRRRIERRLVARPDAASGTSFYCCSLSCRTVVYKGLFTSHQVRSNFSDLNDLRLGVETIRVFWKPLANGRRQPVEVPGTEATISGDLVLLALGYLGPEGIDYLTAGICNGTQVPIS